MPTTNNYINYGMNKIHFCTLFSERTTLEIAVHPDLSVVVRAPKNTDYHEIEKRVFKRARWIQKQLAYFQQFEPRTPERRYIMGESHLYLGKRYRLKITNCKKECVKLIQGFFHVMTEETAKPETIKLLLEQWYTERSRTKFIESFENCWTVFKSYSLPKPDLKIIQMKKRWGSLSLKGRLTLNRDLIRAPKECIDYVITHELCHLLHQNHTPEFYSLLERVMPDWQKRKHKLEMALV